MNAVDAWNARDSSAFSGLNGSALPPPPRAPDGPAHLDGVEADVVAGPDEGGDVVQAADAAVRPERPDRLVLEDRGVERPVGMRVHVRALDDAAVVAGVPGPADAVALADELARRLAADLRGQLEAPAAEVPRGIAAGLVHDVGEPVGAVRVERALLLGDVVLERRLGELRDRRLELLVVGEGDGGAAGRVDDDRLQPLRAHHRAQAAAPGT